MKTILYMTSSINGYIAKENGDTPWSDIIWQEYYNFIKEKKNIVVGRKTYEAMKEVGEFEKTGNPFAVVVTNSQLPNEENIHFVSSPKKAIDLLKQQGFEEVIIGGGAALNTSFLKDNLIDEIQLFVESKIFGAGIKFIEGDTLDIDLTLISSQKLSDTVSKCTYHIIHNS